MASNGSGWQCKNCKRVAAWSGVWQRWEHLARYSDCLIVEPEEVDVKRKGKIIPHFHIPDGPYTFQHPGARCIKCGKLATEIWGNKSS